ncbi:MAG: UDP-N-acetylmuramoyl-L-alanyl-D-glutamate--2,6-diaminopimelate ligase [Chromatiales bacterium]|nr:UDP-N-acetylmuramoyl-L-alanyl-D-glutamate--2,6-diaminopimelate ligase [Chromatiales bacterium]
MNAVATDWALGPLLRGLAEVPGTAARLPVGGLALDSRRVHAGDLFLACAGTRQHGLSHAAQAIERGAVAVAWERVRGQATPAADRVPFVAVDRLTHKLGVVADRFYGHPSQEMGVMGVTGTDGKTSVTQFLAQALDQGSARCGVVGTLGYGLHGALQPGTHTTPDAITLQRELAAIRDAGARWLAMEVSSHALDQGRVNGVAFDYALFTNLGRDHLDYHGSLEAYGAAKQRLFTWPGLDYAIINLDDAFGRALSAAVPAGVRQLGYSLEADVRHPVDCVAVRRLDLHAGGFGAEVVTPWGRGELEAAVLGRFNVQNLLAVLATLLAIGVELPDALLRLRRIRPVPGRMQLLGGGTRPQVVVDYAHTPGALEQVLGAAREHTAGRLVCVFGCGGDRDAGKRPLMAAVAERLADTVIVTDDNPRHEDPATIVADILAGFREPAAVTVEHDREVAIRAAIAAARPGDLVVVAGKGHETVQQLGGRAIPFSDVEVATRCLSGGAA